MNTRFALRLRLCGIVLLLLACSPLTAPFSTLGLGDLLADPAPHDTAAVVQIKASGEKPAAAAAAAEPPPAPVASSRVLLARTVPLTVRAVTVDLPLRI